MEDAQAALQELGRENQSLQVITHRTVTRKWADDDKVNACMACDKGFSVTVRKVEEDNINFILDKTSDANIIHSY
jgi:hypothetical protein